MTAKREKAYNKFRTAIFSRTFKPGQFLTQAEISKKLNISLGPLRDAIKRLEWEELVFVIPQRGLQIALPNIKDIKEAFQFRIILEKEAVRYFTKHPSQAVLVKLESATHALAKKHQAMSLEENILNQALDLDYSLHEMLINELKNNQLKQFYQVVFDKIRIAWIVNSYTHKIVKPVMEEHIQIIDAIKTGDPKLAAHVMERHLNQSLRRIMGV